MSIKCVSKVNRSPANRLDLDEAIFDFLVFALSLLLQDAWMGTGQSAYGAGQRYTQPLVSFCWLVLCIWKLQSINNNNELCTLYSRYIRILLFSRTSLLSEYLLLEMM
jgi:hypothetical protein